MPRLFLKLRIVWTENRLWLALQAVFGLLLGVGCWCCLPAAVDEVVHVPRGLPVPVGGAATVAEFGAAQSEFGWAGPAAVADLAPWIQSQPQFELIDETGQRVWQDNNSADVRLWQMVAHAGGEYPAPNFQETGDCTSWGGADAIVCTQGGQAEKGEALDIQRPFQPWLYGAGRVWIWAPQIGGVRRLPAAGCTGAAIARAAKEFGVVPYGTPGLPEYSGELADQWGRKGPPEELKAIAAQHRVKTVSRITSTDEARDAVCNYYGFTVASSWGNPRGRYQKRDGRLVAQRTGTWNHQMCCNGYDGSSPSGRKYFHIQNSWPVSQHPQPIDDSPAGGFWIEAADLQDMLDAGDSWAFSDFEGFPARNKELDLSPLRPKPR